MSESGVVKSFDAVIDSECRVLVLGSVPSPASRKIHLNYGNPRNRFWPVLGKLFGEELPASPADKLAWALAHHIALWDVLESCSIVGASDASIKDPVPNDIAWACEQAPINQIFCTGTRAAQLFKRLVEPELGRGCIGLPSTSPANARMSLDDLVEAYVPLKEVLCDCQAESL